MSFIIASKQIGKGKIREKEREIKIMREQERERKSERESERERES